MRITPEQRTKAETAAIADYAEYSGQLLKVSYILGYTKEDDSLELSCDPPIVVRVLPGQKAEGGLLHWNSEWLDPYWDVELVLGSLEVPLRSLYIDGPSYNVITGSREWPNVEIWG